MQSKVDGCPEQKSNSGVSSCDIPKIFNIGVCWANPTVTSGKRQEVSSMGGPTPTKFPLIDIYNVLHMGVVCIIVKCSLASPRRDGSIHDPSGILRGFTYTKPIDLGSDFEFELLTMFLS